MLILSILYCLVSLIDLLLTGLIIQPDHEANPVARWVWEEFGFAYLIVFKALMVFLILLICRKINQLRPTTAKIILCIGVLLTSLVCLLFGVTFYEW